MFQPVGTHQDLIKHPDVAARLDGVDEMRQHVLSRIHDNIVTPKGCSLRITVPAWSNLRPQLCFLLYFSASLRLGVQSACLSSPHLSQCLRGSASNPQPQLCFSLAFLCVSAPRRCNQPVSLFSALLSASPRLRVESQPQLCFSLAFLCVSAPRRCNQPVSLFSALLSASPRLRVEPTSATLFSLVLHG